MKIFEIHITGDSSIDNELDKLEIKNIVIGLLKPDQSLFRIECMSSFISKFETYEKCKDFVDNLVKSLKCQIFRVKIESPVYQEYVERAIYMEAHFPINSVKSYPYYPLSENMNSGKILGTSRVYSKDNFELFQKKWKDHEVELCLYDDYIREDQDWFDLYKK